MMAFELFMKPKLKRQGGKKSRTGCRTCKIRRVKCDESKPACNRCTSTNRVCDFTDPSEYSNPQTTPRPSSASRCIAIRPRARGLQVLLPKPTSPLSNNLSAFEGDHLQYFRLVCTRSSSKYSENDLWDKIIFQVAESEPAIRDAAVALGAALRLLSQQGDGNWTVARKDIFRRYRDAVKSLSSRLDDSSPSWDLALLGSLLFTSFEVLFGHDRPSLQHFDAGLAILGEYESRRDHKSDMLQELSTAFLRFETQAATFAVFYQTKRLPHAAIPLNFKTVQEARIALDLVLSRVHYFGKPILGRHRTLPYKPPPKTHFTNITEVKGLLEKWSAAFENSPSLDRENTAAQTLEVQHLAAHITASTVFYRDELAYDAFKHHFNEIVRLSQSIIQVSMSNEHSHTFTFDMGIIMPLYLTACKCRDPVLRRRAISLLQRSGIEGLWDGAAMACVARWVMRLEEGGEAAEDDDRFVPEERRLREIACVLDRYSKAIRPVSTTRSSDGDLHYVSATLIWDKDAFSDDGQGAMARRDHPTTPVAVAWGNDVAFTGDYPSQTGEEDPGLVMWVAQWRAHVEMTPITDHEWWFIGRELS